jgi:hypothetical protein
VGPFELLVELPADTQVDLLGRRLRGRVDLRGAAGENQPAAGSAEGLSANGVLPSDRRSRFSGVARTSAGYVSRPRDRNRLPWTFSFQRRPSTQLTRELGERPKFTTAPDSDVRAQARRE